MEQLLTKIKELRKLKGLTQQNMAERLGYKSKSGYCQLEKGEVKLTLEKIEIIAEVLGVNPQVFLVDYKTEDTSVSKVKLVD